MKGHAPAALGLALASVLLAATRIPGEPLWQACAGILSLALVGVALLSLGRERVWIPPLALALLVLDLLVPTSRDAVMAWLPDPVVALAGVLALLYVYHHDATDAPLMEPQGTASLRHALRFLPPLALIALVALLPWLMQRFLPARIGAAFELDGAAGPFFAFLALAAPILSLGLLTMLLSGDSREAAAEPADGAPAQADVAAGEEAQA
jgi:hypothetical protein